MNWHLGENVFITLRVLLNASLSYNTLIQPTWNIGKG